MKNILANYDDAINLVNQIAEFDPRSMQSIICMLIDTCTAKYGGKAPELAEDISIAVRLVNEQVGEYRLEA